MSGTGRQQWWDHVWRDTDEETQRPRVPAIGVDRRVFVKGAACCLVAAVLPAGAAEPGRGGVGAAALPLPPEPLRLDVDDDMCPVDRAFVLDESSLPTQSERIARLDPDFSAVPREMRAAWLEENGWWPHEYLVALSHQSAPEAPNRRLPRRPAWR